LSQAIRDRVKVCWLKQPLPEEDYFRLVAPTTGDTALVVGGGYGYCALYCLKKVGKKGKVIVVEPSPRCVSFLRRLFAGKRNVVLIQKAIMDRKGEMYFSGGDFLSVFYEGGRRVKVSIDTLDHICLKLGIKKVDYMVMDVEGAEIEALKGGRKILRRTKKIAVGAYHLREGNPTWPWVERYLRRLGFRTKVTEDGVVHAWRSTTREKRVESFRKKILL